MGKLSFEEMAKQNKIEILQIKENNIEAKGIYIPEAIISFNDDKKAIIGYPDTGVFMLFKGSYTSSTENRYKMYINEDHRTTRDIIFQSKNAAAQFVLGNNGRSNYWKKTV